MDDHIFTKLANQLEFVMLIIFEIYTLYLSLMILKKIIKNYKNMQKLDLLGAITSKLFVGYL